MKLAYKVITVVGFNACWLVCIIGAARGWPWLGPVVILLFAAALLSASREFVGDTILVAAAAVFGYLADSLLVLLGAFRFPEPAAWGAPSTAWMVALWINLAVVTPVAMGWMSGRMIIAGLFGAFGGVTSYYAGMRLGAIEIQNGLVYGLSMVGVAWVISMPLLMLGLEKTRGLTSKLIDPNATENTQNTATGERAS